MTLRRWNWEEFGYRILFAVGTAFIVFALGWGISSLFSNHFEYLKTTRTRGFFNFSSWCFYTLLIQSYLSIAIRRPWFILPIAAILSLGFVSTFAWSGPNKEMHVAEMAFRFHVHLALGLTVVNAGLCRLIIGLLPDSKPIDWNKSLFIRTRQKIG